MRVLAKTQTLIVFDLEKDECEGQTVADLKLKLENFPGIELNANQQCLRYDGIFLSDEMLLNDVLNEKGDLFFLTRLNPSSSNPTIEVVVPKQSNFEEEGAVGGSATSQQVESLTTSDNNSLLTDSELKDLALLPELDFSTDDEGAAAGVFDEDMELPPDLQQYYPSTVCVDEDLVGKLVVMGYEDLDARIALQASFNDPERAVEYLIDGIPKSLRSTLPDIGDTIAMARTPPPSYTGSMCSDYSMVPTPPTPHSPDVSISSLTNCQNIESKADASVGLSIYETADGGYDANDEADKQSGKIAGKRKHKTVSKFKKRRIEIWAAKATIATATSNIAQANPQHNANANANSNSTDTDAVKQEADLLKKLNYASLKEVVVRPTTMSMAMDVDEVTVESCNTEDAANTLGGDHHENS